MKTASLDREIRVRVDTFVTDLSNVVRMAALEAVRGALGAQLDGGVFAPVRRGPGRPRKSGTPSPLLGSAPKARRGRGGKRTSESVMQTADAIFDYIKANEGQRLEEISKGMGIASKELKLPVQKLFEAKKIKTSGKKRGTKYFKK